MDRGGREDELLLKLPELPGNGRACRGFLSRCHQPCGPWRKGKVKGRERSRRQSAPGPLSHGKGSELSTKPCQYRCEPLATTATCGARCAAFPACLPPPSPELAARVVAWRTAEDQADAAVVVVAGVLEQLHAAITEGLNQEDEHAWEA
jgi:hypothetical protein